MISFEEPLTVFTEKRQTTTITDKKGIVVIISLLIPFRRGTLKKQNPYNVLEQTSRQANGRRRQELKF